MFGKKEKKDSWRGGVYLCTAADNLQADILESKLRSEGIPYIRKYEGAGNYVEIFTGINTVNGIELYVPEDKLEDAENIIIPVDLDECEEIEEQ